MRLGGGGDGGFDLPPSGEGRQPWAGLALFKRFAVAGVAIFFLTAGATAAVALLRIKQGLIEVVPPSARIPIKEITPAKPGKPQTILLIGSDKRFHAGKNDARSDTMMLIRLDPKQEATAVMSIPRDLMTEIPGNGTQKINGSYSLGGLPLTLKTVRHLLSGGTGGVPHKTFDINHAIAVNFRGFRRVVDYIGCVYTDVDRRYYHSNVGVAPRDQYAEIDIQPGYQRLCGQRALDYVRFRHLDNDIVRAARQQDFLRQAKSQLASSKHADDYKGLASKIGHASQVDSNLVSLKGFETIGKLALNVRNSPVREIEFPHTFVNTPQDSYVTATPQQIAKAVYRFLHAKKAPKEPKGDPGAARRLATKRGAAKRRAAAGPTDYATYGLRPDQQEGEDLVAAVVAKRKLKLTMYYPKAIAPLGGFVPPDADDPMPRVYTLRDRAGKPHQAYRIVLALDANGGQYYGVQGTTWKTPPLLDGPSAKLRMRGRTYELHYDGQRLRTVAWRTGKAVYWVSNTLSLELTNTQMRGLARSLTRLGER